jgi:hypothetical protein
MKKLYLLAVLAGTLSLHSCKIMYMPNAQNVPLMREKGEFRANIGVSNFQTAFATSKMMGVVANGQYRTTKWSLGSGSSEIKYDSKRWVSEAGSGFFMPLGEKGVFEVYAGGGYGGITFNRTRMDSMGNATYFDRYNANMIKTYVQPAIGLTAENVDMAFSVRYVGLKFNNIDTIGYTQNDLIVENLAGVEKPFFSFIEPAFTVRLGFKYVKLHSQLVYSHKLNIQPLNRSPLNINVGVNICIAKRHKG